MELGGEDVFVVSNGDDGLEDKNAGSCYSSVAGALVGMFPEDAAVDFVAADYVWELEWISRAGVMPTAEISYVPSSRNLASGYWYTRLHHCFLGRMQLFCCKASKGHHRERIGGRTN